MRRLITALALAASLSLPTLAYADDGNGYSLPPRAPAVQDDENLRGVPSTMPAVREDREWHADTPKQGVEHFMLCIGVAEAGGHSYSNTNYIAHEIAQMNCDRYAREDVARYFRFRHGIEIDPSIVQVTLRAP